MCSAHFSVELRIKNFSSLVQIGSVEIIKRTRETRMRANCVFVNHFERNTREKKKKKIEKKNWLMTRNRNQRNQSNYLGT
jgi:hypothetical protein